MDLEALQARNHLVRVRVLVVVAVLATWAGDARSRDVKGWGPTAMTAGFGSVWVGMSDGRVIRIDGMSGRERGRPRVGSTRFVHDLVAAYGAVWVLAGSLIRVDPLAHVAREIPRVGSATAFAVRAGAGSVWVVDDGSNEILRIDATSGRLVARVGVPGRAWGLAAGPRSVIVLSVPSPAPVTGQAGARVLRRIELSTNRLSRPLARLGCDVGLAVGYGAVWTFDACTGVLARRNPRMLQVDRQSRFRAPSQTPVLGFGSVWLASRGGVLRLEPRTLKIQATIPARSLSLAIDAKAVWALDPAHSIIRKIDPRTNLVVGAPIVLAKG